MKCKFSKRQNKRLFLFFSSKEYEYNIPFNFFSDSEVKISINDTIMQNKKDYILDKNTLKINKLIPMNSKIVIDETFTYGV